MTVEPSLASHRGREIAAVGVILGFFLAFQTVRFDLPGGVVWYTLLEEQIIAADLLAFVREGTFWQRLIEGRLPYGRYDYHGTLMAYLFAPVLALAGPDWTVAKQWPLAFAVGGLLFAYGFMRNLFGRSSALLALVLVVLHPSYEMGMRIGHTVIGYMQFFSMGGLYFLERWWNTRRNGHLFAALLLLGLGMTQLWFYWFWIGLLFVLLFYRADVVRRWPRGRETAAWAAAGILLGLAPLLYRDFSTDFVALQRVIRDGFLSADNPNRAQNYLAALGGDLRLVLDYLTGTFLYRFTFSFGRRPDLVAPYPSNPLYPILVAAAAVFLAWRKNATGERRFLLLPVLLLGMLTVMPVSHGIDVHVFFLYPVPQMILAVAGIEAFARVRGLKGPVLLLSAVLLLTGIQETRGLAAYARQLVATGGAREHSQTLHEIVRWTADLPGHMSVLVFSERGEWLFRHLYFMFPERYRAPVVLNGAYNPSLGVHDPLRLAADFGVKLRAAGGSAILLCDGEEAAPFYKPFPLLKWLRDTGVPHRLLKVFADRDGYVLMRAYGIGPAFGAENDEPSEARFTTAAN
jgi:hypothetical protein